MAEANPEREPLEELAADFMERLRQGQRPSIEDYAAQHPELAEEIRELFPTIAVTERLKARQQRSSGGRVSLGSAQLSRLGDFRLIREIGRGGMGVVFEAEQESLGRRVAVKVLPRQVLLEEKHLKRFEREARIAANLHHTNIVEVFGVGQQDGFHYLVMQFIQGVGLDRLIPELAKAVRLEGAAAMDAPEPAGAGNAAELASAAQVVRQLLSAQDCQKGRLGLDYWRNVGRLGLQLAEALSYAHGQGVLHRDIKPANLLLDTQGTVWLADFGLAKSVQSEAISLSSEMVGTLRYMAPEQLGGKADARSDLYSLGLTLYELLALRPAYEESEPTRLMQRISQGAPPPPSSFNRDIPRDLETIILKASSHEPSQRYPSAGALAEELRCFLDERPIQARRSGPLERLGRWCRRNPALASLSGMSLVLLLLVALTASVGFVRTRNALQGEALERAKAEATAHLAREALERMFSRFSPSRIRLAPQLPLEGAPAQALEGYSSPILSREAAGLLEEMLPFYDRLAQQTGNDERLRAATAQANARVGAIRQRLGQWDEALKAYGRAAALFEGLLSRSAANASVRLQLAQSRNELGRLYAARRQFAQARQAHASALALLQSGAAAPSESEQWRFELAQTYYLMGTQERPLPAANPRHGQGPASLPQEQRESLAKAVGLLNSMGGSAATKPDQQHLLALCYLEGAAVGEARERESKGGAERAIELLEELVQAFPAEADYAFDLSEAYARIHIPRPPIEGQTQKAILERFGKSLGLLETLVAAHPDIPQFTAAEARLQDKLGSFYRQLERWPEAEQSFAKALALQAPLVKQFPQAPAYGLWMATFGIAHADVLLRRNQTEPARSELEATLAALLAQLEQRPDISRPHELLALGYSRLAIARRQAGQESLALEASRKAELESNSASQSVK